MEKSNLFSRRLKEEREKRGWTRNIWPAFCKLRLVLCQVMKEISHSGPGDGDEDR